MRTIVTKALLAAALALAVAPVPARAQVPGGVWSRSTRPSAWDRFRSRFVTAPAALKRVPRAPADVTTGRTNVGGSKPWLWRSRSR
jgi:hypothetical protein